MSKIDFKNLRRREFLAALGGMGAVGLLKNPLSTLIGGVANGVIRRATAESADELANELRYVSIMIGMAPARWAWDNFLTPKTGALFQNNKAVKNAFTEFGGVFTPEYASWNYSNYPGGGILLPALWGSSLPIAGGGTLPDYSSLLQNSIMIRGIDVGADTGHEDGPNRALQPAPGGPGIHGRMADKSKFPIPLVGMHEGHISHGYDAVGSGRGTRAAPVLYTPDGSSLNPMDNFLGRFLQSTEKNIDGTNISLESIEILTQATLNKIGDHQKSRLGDDSVNLNLKNAEVLVRTAIQSAISEFIPVYTKYLALMAASASPITMNGKMVDGSDKSVQLISSSHIQSNAMFGFNNIPSTSIAANFAVTEILLKNNLAGSIGFGLDNQIFHSGPGGENYFFDEHGGFEVNLPQRNSILNFVFRTLSASINELKSALVANGTWDKTTIHVASEFGRCGIDIEGQGFSDHAPNATSVMLFSGRINQFMPIGNIHKLNTDFANLETTESSIYNGTWGAAAPVSFGSTSRIIGYQNVANTVANLIGVEKLSSAPSLVSVSGDSFEKGVADEPTNVE